MNGGKERLKGLDSRVGEREVDREKKCEICTIAMCRVFKRGMHHFPKSSD